MYERPRLSTGRAIEPIWPRKITRLLDFVREIRKLCGAFRQLVDPFAADASLIRVCCPRSNGALAGLEANVVARRAKLASIKKRLGIFARARGQGRRLGAVGVCPNQSFRVFWGVASRRFGRRQAF